MATSNDNIIPCSMKSIFSVTLLLLLANIGGAQKVTNPLSLCSSQNTGSGGKQTFNKYNSVGFCSEYCDDYSFGIVQGEKCWCSNTQPGDTVSTSQCSDGCPGYGTDRCGNADEGLFGYIQLAKARSTEAGSSSQTSTSSEQSSSSSQTRTFESSTDNSASSTSQTPAIQSFTSQTSTSQTPISQSSTSQSSTSQTSSSQTSSSETSSSQTSPSQASSNSASTSSSESSSPSTSSSAFGTSASSTSPSTSSKSGSGASSGSANSNSNSNSASGSQSTLTAGSGSATKTSSAGQATSTSNSASETSSDGSSQPTASGTSSASSNSNSDNNSPSASASSTDSSNSAPTAISQGGNKATGDHKSFWKRGGAVAGTFVAVGVVVLILLGLLIFLCWRRRYKSTPAEKLESVADSKSPSKGDISRGGGHAFAPFAVADGNGGHRRVHSSVSGYTDSDMNLVPIFDQRVDPNQFYMHWEQQGSRASLQDYEDYSRRVLRVTNPE